MAIRPGGTLSRTLSPQGFASGMSVPLGLSHFLSLPGTSGNFADSPDVAALDIAGDIDIRACIAPNSVTPAAASCILTKWNITGNQRSYFFALTTTGTLQFNWSTTGGADGLFAVSTVAIPTGAAQPLWVRATLDVDNGAVGRNIAFYTSTQPVSTAPASVVWNQLGTTVTQAVVTAVFSGTATANLGASDAGTASLLAGKLYYAEIRNGIGGTIVASPDFRSAVPGAASVTDSTGKVWTVRGTAAIV